MPRLSRPQRSIKDVRTVGGTPCPTCRGRGEIPFDPHYTDGQLLLALWLLAEIEREQSKAGTEVMKALEPRLEL